MRPSLYVTAPDGLYPDRRPTTFRHAPRADAAPATACGIGTGARSTSRLADAYEVASVEPPIWLWCGECFPKPVQRAADMGHDVENDGPTMGGADRWTCLSCGMAALRYAGNVYGSAVAARCPSGTAQEAEPAGGRP